MKSTANDELAIPPAPHSRETVSSQTDLSRLAVERPGPVSDDNGSTTYGMQISRGGVVVGFRVGRSIAPLRRAAHLNRAALPSHGGVQYEVVLTKVWPHAFMANDMSGRLKAIFGHLSYTDNRDVLVGLTIEQFEAGWREALEAAERPTDRDGR